MSHYVIVSCPYCHLSIQIFKADFKCRIFRHGAFKQNGLQIPPHLEKKECDRLYAAGEIYGCGKPFLLKNNAAEACDYI